MELYVDASMSASGAKGMMQVMGAMQSEEEKTTWMARPADRAYQVLQDLITAEVFSSLQNLKVDGKSSNKQQIEEVYK